MKLFVATLFLLLAFTLISHAQTQKGTWQLSANLNNLSYIRSNPYTGTFTGTLVPSAGYFLVNNLVLGVFDYKTLSFGVGVQYLIGQ